MSLLFIHSFLNGLALVYFETTANTLFLMNYDSSDLPYIYIFTSIISVIIGYFYTKLEDSLNVRKLLSITLLFLLFVVIFFFISITLFKSKMLYMWIMVFKDIMWIFAGIEFGILTGMIFNIRQGKRLFGLLVSGEILAGIIGGLSIGFIIELTDTINLLVISSFALVVSFILLLKILSLFSDRFKEDHSQDSIDDEISYMEILKNRYYVLFFIVSILAFFVFYFIDYIFFYEVENNFTDEKELASFFGIFFAMLNIVNLFSSLFLSGAVLSRFGIVFGLLVIPLMAIVGVGSLLIISSISIIFIILVGVKLLNEVFDISILTPTFRVLYQPIPAKQRVKVLAFRETIIEPTAMGVVGLSLLFFTNFDGIELVCSVIVLISLVWLYFARELRIEYIKSLEKVIDKRKFFTDDILYNGVNEQVLLNGLSSDNEIEILYYLNLLEKFNYGDLRSVLISLISHKSVLVRKSVLEKVRYLNLVDFLEILNRRMKKESDDNIFQLLLITYCKLGGKEVVKEVAKYKKYENGSIQESCLVGLLKYCGTEGSDIANKVLKKLFKSNKIGKKKVALLVLSNFGIDNFHEEFKNCLVSDDFEIRKLAIETVGKLNLTEFIPIVLENINFYEFRQVTIFTLMEFGDTILDELKELFINTDNLNNKITIIKIFGNMDSDDANKFLLKFVKQPLLTDTILKALFKANYVADDVIVNDLIKYTVKNILSDLMILNSFDKDRYPNTYLVFKELTDVKINSIFLILGFKYSNEVLSQVKDFSSSLVDTKAYAVELIDNLLPIELNIFVLPILDDGTIESKLARYSNEFIPNQLSQEQLFNEIITNDEFMNILKISLIYEIGKSKDNRYLELVNSSLESDFKLIKETAHWASDQLNKKV